MKLWKWIEGRPGSGYFKLPLAYLNPFFDLYLIKFPKGSEIGLHTDPVPGRKHYRFNIELKKARGGYFSADYSKGVFWRFWNYEPERWRFVLFRPDIQVLQVSLVGSVIRWVLSFGFALSELNC